MASITNSVNLDTLVINKVPTQEIYDSMQANNQINENEIYLIEDGAGTGTSGAAIGSAIVGEDTVLPDYVTPSSMTPLMDGTADVGTSIDYARADHVHPSDTSRAPTYHASSSSEYGVASSENYGHVKLINSLSHGYSLSDAYALAPNAVTPYLTAIPKFVVCSSEAGAAIKNVNIDGLDYGTNVTSGVSLYVYFTNTNTQGSVRLSINNATAGATKSYIYYAGNIVGTGIAGILSGLVLLVYYDNRWNIVGNQSLIAPAGYYECANLATDADKQFGSFGLTLSRGLRVTIKFQYANTANNPTLNYNGTGGKSICHKGSTITTGSNKALLAGVCDFIYDGSVWHLIGNYIDTDTHGTAAELGQGYTECTTAAETTAKVASITNFHQNAHGVVSVKFKYDVPANATLNISSSGAKAIYFNGAAITAGIIKAGDTATFMYYDSHYNLIALDKPNLPSIGCGYGTCTSSLTTNLVAELPGYRLVTGGIVVIKFQYFANANSTLNINGTGAKAIHYRGAAITDDIIEGGEFAVFVYDGTYYNLIATDKNYEYLMQLANFVADDGSVQLTTTAQSIVGAINELNAKPSGGGKFMCLTSGGNITTYAQITEALNNNLRPYVPFNYMNGNTGEYLRLEVPFQEQALNSDETGYDYVFELHHTYEGQLFIFKYVCHTDSTWEDEQRIVGLTGSFYGTCTTAAGTGVRVVSAAGFQLYTGNHITVFFTNPVSANATMNVEFTASKNIVYKKPSGAIGNIDANVILGGDTATFVYTGTYFQLLSIDRVALAPLANGVSY